MRGPLLLMGALALAACAGDAESGAEPGPNATPPDYEPPVALNGNPPVEYPVSLYERQVEGTVLLRLFVQADGTVVPDSTSISESSGQPALDSAALAGVPRMRFAPARRLGVAVETAFIQPVHFRHPDGASASGGGERR